MSVLDHRQAADAGTNIHADAFGILFGYNNTGVLERLHTGHQAKMDESIHTACIFGRQILRRIKILDLASHLASEGAWIKMRNPADAGFSRNNVLPRLRY